MPVGAANLGFRFISGDNEFPNYDFENGLKGWTVYNGRVIFNGAMQLAGYPTPINPLPNPYGSPGDVGGSASFSYQLSPDVPPGGGKNSVALSISGGVNQAGGSLYGPALFSDDFVNFNAGEICQFQYRAVSTGDAYNIMAYLIEKNTGNTITLLRVAAPFGQATTWLTSNSVVPISGSYRFVFVNGNWDSTLGLAIGGYMLIDNITKLNT